MPCILLVYIIGERERANPVVHLAAIFLVYIYITGAAHTLIPIQLK